MKRRCPADFIHLRGDYLTQREVLYQGNYLTVSHRITKGCSQGSNLGPSLWNLVMDSLLKTLDALQAKHAAYADDLVLIIPGNSRLEVEAGAQRLTDVVADWAAANHLRIANSKTVMGELKGTFKGRPPIVKLGGTNLRMKDHFTYLGVTFGRQLQDKTSAALEALTRVAHSTWGLNYPMQYAYYKTIFLAIISYGAGAWADLLSCRNTQLLI